MFVNVALELRIWAIGDGLGNTPQGDSKTCLAILKHGQTTRTTSELAIASSTGKPRLHPLPTAVHLDHDRFNVHQSPLHGSLWAYSSMNLGALRLHSKTFSLGIRTRNLLSPALSLYHRATPAPRQGFKPMRSIYEMLKNTSILVFQYSPQ